MVQIAETSGRNVARRSIFSSVAALVRRIQENRARNAMYRLTVAELSNLSNHDLADLGIQRSMITRVAHEAAWGK